jgi:predicted MFS family arabinose efflux permease
MREALRADAAVFIGYMSLGIQPLAIILLVHEAFGSYAKTGLVASAPVVTGAFSASIQGRLIDRYGPRPVLSACAIMHCTLLGVFIMAVRLHGPLPVLVVLAAGIGACFPQLVSTLRVVWTMALPDVRDHEAAYALVTMTYQLPLVIGPVLVAVLVRFGSATLALAIADALAAVGTGAFVAAPVLRRWQPRPDTHASWLAAVTSTGMPIVLIVSAASGLVGGVLQLGISAFAIVHKDSAMAGVLLATLSVGNLLGSFLYGGIGWRVPLVARYTALQLLFGLLLASLALSPVPLSSALLLLVTGMASGALAIASTTLVGTLNAAGSLTQAFSLNVTAAMLGNAAGLSGGGLVVQGAGYPLAMAVSGTMLALSAGTCAVFRSRLALPAQHAGPGQSA